MILYRIRRAYGKRWQRYSRSDYSPLMHFKNVRSPRNIRMNRHWKDKLIVFFIEIVEMVKPKFLHHFWWDPPVTVGSFFYEHHSTWIRILFCIIWRTRYSRWQIVDIPTGRYLVTHQRTCWGTFKYCTNLDKSCILALHKWLHPLLCLFFIVDLCPAISDSQPIHLGIIVTHAMIIFNTSFE